MLEGLEVDCETVRVVDHDVRFGVSSDEGDGDEWPPILEKVLGADILVIGTPIWFGVRSSVCQIVIERLDGTYNTTNDAGQYPLYNTVAGVVVTGNEGGAHDAASNTLSLAGSPMTARDTTTVRPAATWAEGGPLSPVVAFTAS